MNYEMPKINEFANALKENYSEVIKNFSNVIEVNSYFKREIILGDIESDTGEGVEAFIRFYNQWDDENNIPIEERQPIKIYIDSGGGDLFATLTMIDAIKMSKTPIWGINIGVALSGGFFTFISCHKRFAYPNSTFLFHEGSTATSGTSGQFENFSAFYKKQLQQLKAITLGNTNISEEEYDSIKKDDVWYTAEEALNKGIVDKIIKEFV